MNDGDRRRSWRTVGRLWGKLMPVAREMRREPTAAESLLWQELRARKLCGIRFRRQHTIGPYVADFYCSEAKLVIEIDGPIHDYSGMDDRVRERYFRDQGLG